MVTGSTSVEVQATVWADSGGSAAVPTLALVPSAVEASESTSSEPQLTTRSAAAADIRTARRHLRFRNIIALPWLVTGGRDCCFVLGRRVRLPTATNEMCAFDPWHAPLPPVRSPAVPPGARARPHGE